ncbi:MAG: hypothetical protein K2Q18_02255 [Bdellovibrionales bacterium]|nr:hypothetical protein [Bdellovibrionales bacterium]
MAQTILSKDQPMKTMAFLAVLILTTSTNAANLCARWESSPRYMKAIAFLATYQDYTIEEFCNLPHVLDLELQPTRIILRDGEVIPHVRIQQHSEYSSCLYMINEKDYSLTSSKCYSGT